MKGRMKQLLCLSFFVLCFFSLASAAFAESPFEKSVQLYQNGKFEDAAKSLEGILKQNKESAAVYYNLGNAYYKLNQKGRAVWAYERALRLDPRDSDIRANLDLMKKQLVDKPT